MELIDKQKILAQLEQAIESCKTDTTWEHGYRTAIQETIDEINDGSFDYHPTQERLIQAERVREPVGTMKIFNRDGSITEVTPNRLWTPGKEANHET